MNRYIFKRRTGPDVPSYRKTNTGDVAAGYITVALEDLLGSIRRKIESLYLRSFDQDLPQRR